MNKPGNVAAKLCGNRPERGRVVLDQPQHLAKAWLSGIFLALRLVFGTAALLSVPVATANLLLLCPASAHAQGGVPLWTNRYDGGNENDGAGSIAVDGSGNVFVTGSSWNGGANDAVTLAYSSAGVPLWTNSFPISSGRQALAVDSSGNVFVFANGWIKYSNSGVPIWTNGGPEHIALDSLGNVFVTGGGFVTLAYSNSGLPLWTNRYIGPGGEGGDHNAWAIAVDRDDNVFVTGESDRNDTVLSELDYATVKYSNGGVPLWTNRYNGPGNGTDQAWAIAVDSSGNAFVTGHSISVNGFPDYDYATIKYSNTGLPLWTNRYNAANYYDDAYAIAVDNSGNVFVTGFSSSGSIGDYATIKYSNAGVPLWTRRYNGPGNSEDLPIAIALDSAGNVFVTGHSYAANGSSDYATLAYSNAGIPLWTKRYNGPGNGDDYASGIAVDRSGNVFVTGYSWNGTNNDYVTIKYSSSVPPSRLDFQLLNNQLVLNWTNAGFTLQSAPAVTGAFTNLPAATSPYTNALTAPQQFFRLISH